MHKTKTITSLCSLLLLVLLCCRNGSDYVLERISSRRLEDRDYEIVSTYSISSFPYKVLSERFFDGRIRIISTIPYKVNIWSLSIDEREQVGAKIELEASGDSVIQYSLDSGIYEDYTDPILVEGPLKISVKASSSSSLFVSSSVTYSFKGK